ncbi:MAG TPA: D-glycero-beta-D-manno-heptose 1-phosphate adenylyltransferase [Gemmataceae bacterium]|nr:D-glycero-beta-D-manno-heptose 1-phosphate adenylyltransferase [Gemmataceae bacterium]
MAADLIDLVQHLGQPHVLVLGDLMLDRYVWGDAERISQEAPVILLHADKREERLGGASSVATMLRALGAKVSLVGVVGSDFDGARIRQTLTDLDIDHDGVLNDADRPSTVKERYIGRAAHRHPQQLLRVDFETREPVQARVEADLCDVVQHQVRKNDIVLISDYDKGVCTPGLLQAAIAAAKERGIRVVADPIRRADYSKYRGCSSMTPNRFEAGQATGRSIQSTNEALAAATQLMTDLDLEAGIVTLDKDGMAFSHRDGRRQIFSTRPRQVYDITGAGDMVMSVLAMALAAGADFDPAIRLANIAGGLEVEKIGVATVSRDEILRDLLHEGGLANGQQKLLPVHLLNLALESRRRLGQRIVFTNGCFDVLHAGHVEYLQEARRQGDVLIVGLNSDDSVRNLKGPSRPINTLDSRALVMTGLSAVDYVAVFDAATPLELIKAVKPDVLVKGADYRADEVVGGEFVKSYGGRIHLAPLREGLSSSNILRRLEAA